MLQLYCQYYLVPLENFTFVEEVVIIKAYLVVIILRLKPNNSFNLSSYRGICRHFVLLSQNLGLLLTLLPLKTTFVNILARVM